MNTPENLSTKLNALNETFKHSEEYFLIQKIQMQTTTVSSVDKNRIKERILDVYSSLFLSISLDKNINVMVACVLSSMQFTSATIAQILNMEDSSVRSLKHRLKKKMEPEVFSLFFEPKDESAKQDSTVPDKRHKPYLWVVLGCVVAAVLFLIFSVDGSQQSELGYTSKNDTILDEHRFIRVSENLPNAEYSLKKGYTPEEVALADLPKKLKREKASRLTIKIDGYDLMPYKSLMESLWKVGVKSHITNEEKDIENTYHTDSRMVRVWIQGEDMPYHIRYNDFAWTCETLEDVLSWVPMLDAHGLCMYPMTDDVPYSILQMIAESAWESNNKQVSMLLKGEDGYYCTILPEERDLVAKYPGYTVRQIETQLLSEYNSKEPDVITIDNPLVRVTDNRTSLYKIERSGKELRIFTSIVQGPDLWISYDANGVIVAEGKVYKCKEIIGMAGCERDIFWSPDVCTFRFCHVYEPLDEDVKEIDINPDSEDDQWYGVQVYPGYNPYDDCLKLEMPYTCVMLHNVDSDSQRDLLYLSAVEYNKDNTMLYFDLALMEPRHVPIFIGDDLTITTKSGSVYNIQRLHGIPLNENFIRHAGYTTSPFRAEFPAITDEIDFVSGTVCGEFLTINGNRESVNTVSE
jgi:hypothetical protein